MELERRRTHAPVSERISYTPGLVEMKLKGFLWSCPRKSIYLKDMFALKIVQRVTT